MTLRRNTIWNLIGNGTPLLAGVALIPFTLKQLGAEAFGVLTLIWGLIGYFSLFDFGTGRALTLQIGKLVAARQYGEIPSTLRAGLFLTFCTGIIGGVLIFLLTPLMVDSWLKINLNFQSDAKCAFQIAALGIVFTTLTSGLRGAQEGLGEFATSNLTKIFLGFGMFALPALSVWIHGPHLWIIALYLILVRAGAFLICIFNLRKYLLRSWNHQISFQKLKTLFSFGAWVTVSGVVGPLMVYGDRFFVSASLGVALLPLYALPQEALQRLLIIPASVTGALLPHLAGLRHQEIQAAYKKEYRRMTVMMGLICSISVLAFYPIFSLWISQDFALKAFPIALILALGIWFNAIAFVPYTFLHAMGNSKVTAYFHLIELVVYLLLLYALVKVFGLPGAAFAWTVRVLIDLVLLSFFTNKTLLTDRLARY